jgi:hypothetical protein
MADVEYENQITAPEETDIFSTLPDKLASPSFFVGNTEDQKRIINYFSDKAKIDETEQIDNLLASSLLSSRISIPALLGKIWITKSFPEKTRITALQRFTTHLTTSAPSLDFQGFIPHLLAALSDSAKPIREQGAKGIAVLHQRAEKLPSRSTVVGLNDLYVESDDATLKWLSASERKWFLDSMLTPKLEECRLDSDYIVRLMGEVLNAAGKKTKKDSYRLSLFTTHLEILLR